MPNYKVVDADQLEEGLGIVGDAIRSKGGTSEKLDFPEEMATAVLEMVVGDKISLQEKTVDPTAQGQVVRPDSGYDGLSKVTINEFPAAEQYGPVIIVTESGKIEVYLTQKAGYVEDSELYRSHQLPLLEGHTIIPKRNEILAVRSGVKAIYGDIFVAPIPDDYIQVSGTLEVSENGEYDVSEHASVNVSVAGGGVGKSADIVARTVKEIEMTVANVGQGAFAHCTALQKAKFHAAKNLMVVRSEAFGSCINLLQVDLEATSIADQAFRACWRLKALILRRDSVVSLIGTEAFGSCFWLTGAVHGSYNPDGEQGWVYVPRALVDSYPSATNWSAMGFRYRALEDYTVDGTIYGELDESKILAEYSGEST